MLWKNVIFAWNILLPTALVWNDFPAYKYSRARFIFKNTDYFIEFGELWRIWADELTESDIGCGKINWRWSFSDSCKF